MTAHNAESVRPMPELLARLFHDTYERLAPFYRYETRAESAVPWEDVPERNRLLMIEVCRYVLSHLPHDVYAEGYENGKQAATTGMWAKGYQAGFGQLRERLARQVAMWANEPIPAQFDGSPDVPSE